MESVCYSGSPIKAETDKNQELTVGENRHNIFISLLCKRSEEKIRVNTHISVPNLKMNFGKLSQLIEKLTG